MICHFDAIVCRAVAGIMHQLDRHHVNDIERMARDLETQGATDEDIDDEIAASYERYLAYRDAAVADVAREIWRQLATFTTGDSVH